MFTTTPSQPRANPSLTRSKGHACGTPGRPFARLALYTLVAVAGLAGAPRPVTAGIDYTWTANDKSLQGTLDTKLTLGETTFTAADVTSFSFTVAGIPYTSVALDPATINIDPSTGGPAASDDGTNLYSVVSTQPGFSELRVYFDANYLTGDAFSVGNSVGETTFGPLEGTWTIAPAAAVPEPSTLVLAGVAVVCGIAYGLARKRRAQRKARNEP